MRASLGAWVLLNGGLAVGCGGSTTGQGSAPGGDSSSTSTATSTVNASTSMVATSTTTLTVVTSNTTTTPCEISASNYDQSCNVDSDCTLVASGDYCSTGCFCPLSTISVGALSQFNADVSQTPIGSGTLPGETCNCPEEFVPCCRGGTCQTGSACMSEPDSGLLDAGNNPLDYTALCVGDAGPSDAGYSSGVAAVPGVSRWCNGPEVCTTFNGGWACCILMGEISTCVSP
jgi:hypothetical protein